MTLGVRVLRPVSLRNLILISKDLERLGGDVTSDKSAPRSYIQVWNLRWWEVSRFLSSVCVV